MRACLPVCVHMHVCVHLCMIVVMLQIEPTASFMPSKHSTTELHPTLEGVLFNTSTWGSLLTILKGTPDSAGS